MSTTPSVLAEANYRALREQPPNVAVLPWGATEAHNDHLPFGTDVIEAEGIARLAVEQANKSGAQALMLPVIPFGNNAQQLDQIATIHLSTATALSLLRDIARSLKTQGIDRLIIANAHGGNTFSPIVRDLIQETGVLIVVAHVFRLAPQVYDATFERDGGHADEMETSVMLHLRPDLVHLDQAGPGERVPFAIDGLERPGVWTPRPWSRCHPDTGAGDPSLATAQKGAVFTTAMVDALAELITAVGAAKPGDNPL
ncbi:creatininase family protein [Phycisphaeraceae bacterium D3-23]